jgi:integrase
VNFQELTVQVARSFVRGVINPTKADGSEGVLPLDSDLAEMILARGRKAAFLSHSDYVLANESGNPRWPESMLTDHIKPAAVKAGIGNIGWHTLRRTYSTLLHSVGTKPAVQKELLRHANIQTTLNVYTRAISEEKRKAASEVAHRLYEFVPAGKLKSA